MRQLGHRSQEMLLQTSLPEFNAGKPLFQPDWVGEGKIAQTSPNVKFSAGAHILGVSPLNPPYPPGRSVNTPQKASSAFLEHI